MTDYWTIVEEMGRVVWDADMGGHWQPFSHVADGIQWVARCYGMDSNLVFRHVEEEYHRLDDEYRKAFKAKACQ